MRILTDNLLFVLSVTAVSIFGTFNITHSVIKHNDKYTITSKHEIVPTRVATKTNLVQETNYLDNEAYTFTISVGDGTKQVTLHKLTTNVKFNCEQNIYTTTYDTVPQWLFVHYPVSYNELCLKGVN